MANSVQLELQAIEQNPLYTNYQQNCKNLRETAPYYAEDFTTCVKAKEVIKTVVILALVVTAVAALVLFATHHLFTFPQDFLNALRNMNLMHLAIGLGVTTVLVGGAAIVIHRARTKKDELLADRQLVVKYKIGDHEEQEVVVNNFANIPRQQNVTITDIRWMDPKVNTAPARGIIRNIESQLKSVLLKWTVKGKEDWEAAYVDKSTLDNYGNGRAFLYIYKHPSTNHYIISRIVPFLGTPVYLIGTMVVNLFRAVIMPFYVLFQGIKQSIQQRCLSQEIKYKYTWKDALRESGLSLWRVAKAPFYALAFFFAGLYSLVNPMGGRKLGAAIERDWNEGITLAEGYWSTQGWMKYGKREALPFRKSFYLAGCWQPIGIVEFENNEVKTAYRMEAAVNPNNEVPYTVQFRDDLEESCVAGEKLVNTHKEISEKLNPAN